MLAINKKKLEKIIGIAILLAVLGIFYYPQFHEQQAAKAKLAEILSVPAQTLQLGERTKTIGCEVRGALPDPDCTPGAVFSEATVDTICVSGYTKKVRNVTANMKKQIYNAYGINYPQKTGSYEADHLIPLELGGSNELANLFPEAAAPQPGFREKDVVENFLHQEVCAGRTALSTAQKQIATDWLAVYTSLSAEQIKGLKSQFKSWAQ